MYHYAGNNPIRYIDPDGRRTVSQNTYRAKNRDKDFNQVGVRAWRNYKAEAEYKESIDFVFDTSSIVSDGQFLLSQILFLAGITEGGLVAVTGGLGVFLGYMALASRLNFHPEEEKYNAFNYFYWEMQSRIDEGNPVFDFTMTFEEDLSVESRYIGSRIDPISGRVIEQYQDVFVNTVTVTCSYSFMDIKNHSYTKQTIKSPKITICKKEEWNRKIGNNLWKETFGTTYYGKIKTWILDNFF